MRKLLKFLIHNIACSILLRCRFDALLQRGPNRRLIIMYHGVRRGNNRINGRHITAVQFEKHLKFFKDHFSIVPLQALCDMKRAGVTPDKHTIALTFDDGFVNNLTVAVPLLEKYSVPATFFVCSAPLTDPSYSHPSDMVDVISVAQQQPSRVQIGNRSFVRQGHRLIDEAGGEHAYGFINTLDHEQWLVAMNGLLCQMDRAALASNQEITQLMNSSSLHALKNYGLIEVGSHSHHHINLTRLSGTALTFQMEMSKKMLETYTAPVRSIAFPYGLYNNETIGAAHGAGYTYLFSGGHVEPIYENQVFPRIGVLDGAAFPYAMLMISNGFRRFGF